MKFVSVEEKNLEVNLCDIIKVEDSVFGERHYLVVESLEGYTVVDLSDGEVFSTRVESLDEILPMIFPEEGVTVCKITQINLLEK